MNKGNKVKQLNRNHEHRHAMLNNMVTSLFKHERIESTVAKIKVVRSFAEKLISKAKTLIVIKSQESFMTNYPKKLEVCKSTMFQTLQFIWITYLRIIRSTMI